MHDLTTGIAHSSNVLVQAVQQYPGSTQISNPGEFVITIRTIVFET